MLRASLDHVKNGNHNVTVKKQLRFERPWNNLNMDKTLTWRICLNENQKPTYWEQVPYVDLVGFLVLVEVKKIGGRIGRVATASNPSVFSEMINKKITTQTLTCLYNDYYFIDRHLWFCPINHQKTNNKSSIVLFKKWFECNSLFNMLSFVSWVMSWHENGKTSELSIIYKPKIKVLLKLKEMFYLPSLVRCWSCSYDENRRTSYEDEKY